MRIRKGRPSMSKMHPAFRKLLILFLVLVTLGVAGGGAAIGALLGYLDELPPLDALENYSPTEVSRVYDRTGNTQVAELFAAERREFVPFRQIPAHVTNAFIAIEDERFYRHYGIDIWGIGRALWTNVSSGGKRQGASTITMQVARNVVLNDTSKRFSRKIKEMLTSLQMERNFSKEQILEFYMNHIFFGARAYGVQAAARAYFNKDVRDLTVPEAAMIAGLPKAPTTLSPTKNKDLSRDRRDLVLRNMQRLGFISESELNRYLATDIDLSPARRPKEEASYFVDYVRSLLVKDASMDAANSMAQKGYTVISSVDLKLQQICEEELCKGLEKVEKVIEDQKEARQGEEATQLGGVKKGQHRLARIKEIKGRTMTVSVGGYTGDVVLPEKLPYFHPDKVVRVGNLIDVYISDIRKNGRLDAYLYDKTHVQGSAVLLDVHTGEILALVGGAEYDDNVNNGQWNRAYQGGRQPGSCWKPLLYGAAWDVNDSNGQPKFTPGTVMVDESITIGNWTPKNYEGRHYGPTALYEALVKSRNIPTIKLFLDIGKRNAVSLYQKYNVVNKEGWDLVPVAPMALGTPNVTPLELAAAYAVFANGGVGITPTPLKRVYSSKSPTDSRVVRPEHSQVLSPQAAYMNVRIMQDVIARGTAKTTVGEWYSQQTSKGRKLPEMAAKTGTTNNCHVAWLTGYTPDLVLAIYVGYDQDRSMGPKVVGGGNVGPIWYPMMDRILQTRDDWKMKFDVPKGIVLRDICAKSGKLATGGCYADNAAFKNAAFKAGSEPKSSCGYHSGGYDGSTPGETDVEGSYAPAQMYSNDQQENSGGQRTAYN